MYAPSSSAFKMPPRVEHTWRDWNQGDKFTRPYPQKRPASVDLQASKKSKGLQVQQFQYHSNTRAVGGLTISIKYTHKYNLVHATQAPDMHLYPCLDATERTPKSISFWIDHGTN